MRVRDWIRSAAIATISVAIVALMPASASTGALSAQQRKVLSGVARDTWRFYAADVDPTTHLPLDNLGPGSVRGAYTSAANIGVYLWAVVAARDLGLIDVSEADRLAGATLRAVAGLRRYDGLLYQWYDTNDGAIQKNPGQGDCTETVPSLDN